MTTPALLLDFWGILVEVSLQTAEDLYYFGYYFQDFMVLGGAPPAVCVRLSTPDGTPFVSSSGRKRVEVRDTGTAWRTCEDYDAAAPRPTPLPPFDLPPLRDTVRTYHASAASHPTLPIKTLIIHGDTTAGKSVLLLALLARGWHFVADDTLVMDHAARILRFTTPIGVRERTQDILPWIGAMLPRSAARYATWTGCTTVVHPNELPFRKAPQMTHGTWGLFLVRGSVFGSAARGPNMRVITLDIQRDLEQAIDVIARWTGG